MILYILLVVRENVKRSELWGTAKVSMDGSGIRYSMRKNGIGVTNHIPVKVSIPQIVKTQNANKYIDIHGYGMAIVSENGVTEEIEVFETWIDEVLDLIRNDYNDKVVV